MDEPGRPVVVGQRQRRNDGDDDEEADLRTVTKNERASRRKLRRHISR